jgi:hypothetical protein
VTPLSDEAVRDFLVEEVGVPAEEALRIARLAHGAIGRALRLLPGEGGAGQAELFRDKGRALLLAAMSGSATPRFVAANAQAPAGGRGNFTGELEALGEWLRDLLATASGADEKVADPEALATLRRAVDQYGIHPLAVAAALDHLSVALHLAQGNVNPQLILADLLARLGRELRPAATRTRPLAASAAPDPSPRKP